jgi:O-methyltransferase
MSMNLRQRVKGAIYPVGSLVPTSRYRLQSLRSWPAVTALLYDIKVPKAVRAKTAPTPASGANINILLDMLDKTEAVAGDIAECGVFRGRTLVPMSVYLSQKRTCKHVFGFDSFEGFDDAVQVDVVIGGVESKDKHVGAFNETSMRLVQSKLKRFGVSNATLVKGYFRETLNRYPQKRFSFVHLDCDIYKSYKECLEFFYPRVNPGGIMLFDEYLDPRWPGCTKAIDEYLFDKAEKPALIVRENHEKYYIQKL